MPTRILELFVCFVLFAVPLANRTIDLPRGPESEPSADEAAIKSVLLNQENAWNQGDVDKFMEGYWKSAGLTFAGWDRCGAGIGALAPAKGDGGNRRGIYPCFSTI